MKLSELIDYLLIESGNFILAGPDDLSKLRLNTRKVWRLVEAELRKYQDYYPVERKFNMEIDQHHVFDETDDPHGRIPEAIAKCTPVASSLGPGSGFVGLAALGGDAQYGVNANLHQARRSPLPWHLRTHIPTAVPFRYERPHLYIAYQGTVDVHGLYNLVMTEELAPDARTLLDVDIPELDLKASTWRDMIEGKFLQAVGRSRRAFTYGALPVESDAEALRQEGKDMYDDALESLATRHKWWLAVQA